MFSGIGASDNVRTGLAHYDTSAMAEGVGGQLVLGYKYTSGGTYTEGAILKMYKENASDGQYGSGLKIQVRNNGEDLATKMRLSPSGYLLVGGDKNPDGTLEVFQEAVGSAGFLVDANATNRSRFEAIVFTDYTRLQAYGMGTAAGHLSLNPLGNRVGVGTTQPAHAFHVKGNLGVNAGTIYLGDQSDTNSGIHFYKSGSELRIYKDDGAFGGTYSAGPVSIDLYNGTTYATRIQGSGTSYFGGGYVAINRTSASEPLDVGGNAVIRGKNEVLNGMGTAGSFNASQIVLNTTNSVNTTGWQGISFDTSTAAGYGWSIGANRRDNGRGSFRFYEHINSDTGIERFTIAEDGNVGIGTSSFVANALITELHIDKPVANGVSRIRLSSSVQGKEGIIGYSGYNNENFIYFNTGNTNASTNKMVINDAGGVGIGTDSPSKKLHVYSTGNEVAFFQGTSGGAWIDIQSSTSNLWSIGAVDGSRMGVYNRTNASYPMVIDNNGNVGIGQFSPGHKLDVDGRIRGVGSIRVDGGATDSPYFGLYQNGVEKGYLQYIDSGDNLRMQSDGVISFVVGTTEGGYFNSSGHLYFNQDLRNNGQAVGGDILNIRGRSNGQYIRMMGGDNGFGIVDSGWSSTLHFRNMNAYGHIYHNNGNPIQIGNGTDQFVKLTGQLKLGVFSQSQTNTGDAWFGRAADRAAGTATIQLGTNTSSKFEVVDYAWSQVLFELNHSGNLYALDIITASSNIT